VNIAESMIRRKIMKNDIQRWIEEEEVLNSPDVSEKEKIEIYMQRERRERKNDICSFLEVLIPVLIVVLGFLYALGML